MMPVTGLKRFRADRAFWLFASQLCNIHQQERPAAKAATRKDIGVFSSFMSLNSMKGKTWLKADGVGSTCRVLLSVL